MKKKALKEMRSTEPTLPHNSLPSYSDPTPETNRGMSREKEAELALQNTNVTRGICTAILVLFFLTIASVPLVQLSCVSWSGGHEALSESKSGHRFVPTGLQFPSRFSFEKLFTVPKTRATMQVERAVEQESVVAKQLRPWVQFALSYLEAGSEQVYFGSGGWLFYRADVDHLTGNPFLNEEQLNRRIRREAVQPDPVRAITDFGAQLRRRGIELVVMPVPVKPSIETYAICGHRFQNPVRNESFKDLTQRLSAAGIRVFDAGPELTQKKLASPNQDLYLRTDTHWRPETMEFVAKCLAHYLQKSPPQGSTIYSVQTKVIQGRGDTALMLNLPSKHRLFPEESVTIHPVACYGSAWRPDESSEVLLLGDSFANIYSLEKMGWGAASGLAEQLSVALGGPAIDRLVRNSDGAFATREMLAQELARGRDRLMGKRIVVWEFASRELSFGNWKLIEMKASRAPRVRFFLPRTSRHETVSGVVESVSTVPAPGTVPYPDHIMCLHLVELKIKDAVNADASGAEAVVYLWSMRGNSWTRAAHLRAGDRVKVDVCRWSEMASEYETFNRSELDDPALQLAEPLWGELLK